MTSALPVVDCHCHLADRRLSGELASIVAKCASDRVLRILVNGTCPHDWRSAMEIAEEHGLDAAVGLHPFMAEMWSRDVEKMLCDCISCKEVHAIGEIGLEASDDRQCHELRRKVFSRQLDIARDAGLPAALHIRVAWPEFFELLSEKGIRALEGYCHNFTGSWETARRLLDLGLHLSFNTSILKGKRVLKAAELAPSDRILTETDSPDMPFGGEAKRPWHARAVLARLAEVRQCSLAEMSDTVLSNYDRLFGREMRASCHANQK